MSKARDLLAAAQAVLQYAEKTKLDGSAQEYAILQPLKDAIAIYEISETKLRAAAPAFSH